MSTLCKVGWARQKAIERCGLREQEVGQRAAKAKDTPRAQEFVKRHYKATEMRLHAEERFEQHAETCGACRPKGVDPAPVTSPVSGTAPNFGGAPAA